MFFFNGVHNEAPAAGPALNPPEKT